MRTETRLGLATLVLIGIAAACGGRAGTEIFGYSDVVADGGVGTGGSTGTGGGIMEGGPGGTGGTTETGGTAGAAGTEADASIDVSEDVSADTGVPDAPNDAKDFWDSFPIPDSPCKTCLQDNCPDINACYNDPVCVQGIQCTVTDCLAGGGGGGNGGSGGGGGQIDYMCVLGCFNNDFGAAMTAISAFSCITQTCGTDCGLGGLAGSGGGGGNNIASSWTPFGSDELFGAANRRALSRSQRYIGSVRVPAPEEVACCYPWLVDVLSGRLPDPLPPSMAAKRKP